MKDLEPAAPDARAAAEPSREAPPPAGRPVLWAADIRAAAPDQARWLWHGFLAPGNVTLLTSIWKSGKTTLLSVLLHKLGTGGQLAGQALRPGKALVVTEESPLHWQPRCQQLDFGTHVGFICRPFTGQPRPADWLALLDQVAGLRREHALDLLVIDPLANVVPGRGESNAGLMLETLLPLQRLTGAGMSVLILHHPRRGETTPGQAARGSGALSGFADILLEMDFYRRGDDTDRRRTLRAFSRHPETPRRLVIEWSADGTDYACLGTFADEEFQQTWQTVEAILAGAPRPLTRRQILDAWPEGESAPGAVTLWAWLNRAVNQGLAGRGGSGHKHDPFTFWLPGQMAKWQADPVARLFLDQIDARRNLAGPPLPLLGDATAPPRCGTVSPRCGTVS